MTLFASLNDVHAVKACIRIPKVGAWSVDLALDKSIDLSVGSKCIVQASDIKLHGTLVRGGNYHGQFSGRIVGGAGGWAKPLKPKYYTVPTVGVRLAMILKDAARECGETIGTIPDRVVGYKYFRKAREGSYLLHTLIGPWYVGFSGVTEIVPRTSVKITSTIVDGRPYEGVFAIATDELSNVLPGNILMSADGDIPISYVIHNIGSKVSSEVFS